MNPYEVLGVSENADADTVKSAYRKLVKKYHPDNYKDNPLADLANEKLREINEAYEMITKGKSSGEKRDSATGGAYGYQNTKFAYVRSLIQQRRLADADAELSVNNDGSAEWHYLKGCVCVSRGWTLEGISHLQTAVNMDPSNAEYANMLNSLRMRQSSFNATGNGYGYNRGNTDMCNCCGNLLCADCCCEMMGGDLIPCC